jgi:hypothetical protein
VPQQKLVTVYLDNLAYGSGKWINTGYGDKHGLIEEHLAQYLADGWTIRSFTGFGGGGESITGRAWLAVLLERP